MDTLLANHNAREAYWAAREATPVESSTSLTDTANMRAIDQMLVDMALMKREAARRYMRKRWSLRKLVAFGVFSPDEARAAAIKSPLANLLNMWRLLRAELKQPTDTLGV